MARAGMVDSLLSTFQFMTTPVYGVKWDPWSVQPQGSTIITAQPAMWPATVSTVAFFVVLSPCLPPTP